MCQWVVGLASLLLPASQFYLQGKISFLMLINLLLLIIIVWGGVNCVLLLNGDRKSLMTAALQEPYRPAAPWCEHGNF